MIKTVGRACASIFFSIVCAGSVYADSWPTKPIKLVVPYPPGGGTDIIARLLSPGVGAKLGQPLIVENKPGASTVIGTSFVARAAPDGYTIGLITDSHAINPAYIKNLPYDSVGDFSPVAQLVRLPFVLLAGPKSGISSLADLVAEAKRRPGEITYASIGNGTPHALAMELFTQAAGIELTHVPYTGVAPALNDVLGGQVDVMFTGLSTGMPYVHDNRLKALAVSSAHAVRQATGVPSIAESGYPGFEFVPWYGLVAPKGTPDEIVEKLAGAVKEVLTDGRQTSRLDALGIDTAVSTPVEFHAFLVKMTDDYARIAARAGAVAK